ncbi:hypothetical protein HFP57_08905 [Parasphingopyxis algicola]|uniref:hypothetical protein n=1 Tax=Parasphingopyxis algicola TaxID=2026624 RepID=UPI0015A29D18|nr:hypothetical protein [Parasphingopyxis algicola]QLC25131.1 hypothetical protein HFP57_08905 [Parasphingopyxis algicola]
MAWPAWIISALAHPQVRRAGIEAATKAGSLLADRLAKRKGEGGTEILPPEEGQPSDADLLREAMESLPTKQELAEAIAALDAQSEARVNRLRGTIILIAIVQFAAFAILLAVLL